MEIKQKDLFDIALNFLGWGDPHSGIWFVGIEEASDWNTDNINQLLVLKDKTFIYETKFNWKELGAAGRGVRDYMSKICFSFSSKYKNKTWQEFRNENLWAEKSQVFQVNLYPLGKANLKIWPAQYKEIFGYSADDKEAYSQAVVQYRFPLILKNWNEYKPQATVCFGVTAWNEFRLLFDLGQNDLVMLAEDIYCSESKKIVLCPFLGQGMSDAKVSVIMDQLRKWNISIT